KSLSAEEIETVAALYREFRTTRAPDAIRGFCATVPTSEIARQKYSLTPGRYVGADLADDEEDEPIEEFLAEALSELKALRADAEELDAIIDQGLLEVMRGV